MSDRKVILSLSTLVIFNPTAGRGRAQDAWPQVREALHQAGVRFGAVATDAPLHAVALARQAAAYYDRVVSVGGDGTLHEAANGLLQASGEEPTIPLGIVPLGNGDDFAKILPPVTPIGAQPFDWRAAVEKIARGQTQLFDAVRMVGRPAPPAMGEEPHYFINAMDIGFGATVSLNFRRTPKFLKGMAGYLAATAMPRAAYPRLQVGVQFDEQPPIERGAAMAAVANGRCFGNGFWICPDAQADDGLLDAALVAPIGRLAIMQLLPQVMKGAHQQSPHIQMQRVRRVVIESVTPFVVEADGELPYLAAQHLELQVLPRRLRMIV